MSTRRLWPLAGAASAALLLAVGCATGGVVPGVEEAGTRERFDAATRALQAGDFEAAGTGLRELASSCDAGGYGRQAVLLLAAAALDPRNPAGSADEAARLAAHYLGLQEEGAGDRAVAETLFLLALDQGGRSEVAGAADGETIVSGLAPRYHDCAAAVPDSSAVEPTALPELPGLSTADLLVRIRTERDSLAERTTELEAELERIRRLLREGVRPDTLRRRR